MLQHVVLLNFNEKITEQALVNIGEGFAALAESLSEIVLYRYGKDLDLFQGNADYALVAVFNTEEEFKAYVDNESHQAFMQRSITPYLASFQSTQFALDF